MTYDLICIGNAILDIIARVENSFLQEHQLEKGSMALISKETSERLYDALPPAQEQSGGAGANTVVGFSALGGRSCLVSKVADDAFGRIFTHDMKAMGVDVPLGPIEGGSTACCISMVTPDADRTMRTFTGVSDKITLPELPTQQIKRTKLLLIEGYMWTNDMAVKACIEAANLARKAGGKVVFTLSDVFLIKKYKKEFLSFISNYSDILMGNKLEFFELFEKETIEEVSELLKNHSIMGAITLGGEGAFVFDKERSFFTDRSPAERVIDTTGAGDLYASGFLYGVLGEMPLEVCGELASRAAAESISHLGARPDAPLKHLLEYIN